MPNLDERQILEIAIRYGGVISASLVAYTLGTDLRGAKKALEDFVKEGEARKVITVEGTFYDFPTVRIYLLPLESRIIRCIIEKGGKCERGSLFQNSGIPSIESFDEVMKRLERNGFVKYDPTSEIYWLRGFLPESTIKIKELPVFPRDLKDFQVLSDTFLIDIEIKRSAEKLKHLLENVRKDTGDEGFIGGFFFNAQEYRNRINKESEEICVSLLNLLRKKYPWCSILQEFIFIKMYSWLVRDAQELLRDVGVSTVLDLPNAVFFYRKGENFVKCLLDLALSEEIIYELNKPLYKMVCELLKNKTGTIDLVDYSEFDPNLVTRALDLARFNDLIQPVGGGKFKVLAQPPININCPRCESSISGYENLCPNCQYDTKWLITIKKPKPRPHFVANDKEGNYEAYFSIFPDCDKEYPLTSEHDVRFADCEIRVADTLFERTFGDELFYLKRYPKLPSEIEWNLRISSRIFYRTQGSLSEIIAKLDVAVEDIKKCLRRCYKEALIEMKRNGCKEKPLITEDEFVELAFEDVMGLFHPRLDKHPVRFVAQS